MIVQEREGQVLGKSVGTLTIFTICQATTEFLNISVIVLKTDRFPTETGDKLEDLEVHVTDAPNFRQIRGEPLFAVGQPSRHSIRTILNLLRGKTVRWISLREGCIHVDENHIWVYFVVVGRTHCLFK